MQCLAAILRNIQNLILCCHWLEISGNSRAMKLWETLLHAKSPSLTCRYFSRIEAFPPGLRTTELCTDQYVKLILIPEVISKRQRITPFLPATFYFPCLSIQNHKPACWQKTRCLTQVLTSIKEYCTRISWKGYLKRKAIMLNNFCRL